LENWEVCRTAPGKRDGGGDAIRREKRGRDLCGERRPSLR